MYIIFRYIKLCLLVCVLPCFSLFSANAADSAPQPVYVFDVWKFFEQEKIEDTLDRVDFLYFLTALQGIANRDQPSLYLIASLALFDVETRFPREGRESDPVTEIDEFWLDYLVESGDVKRESLVRTTSLEEILKAFQDRVRGLVIWEMDVPATVNAALTAASARDLLPVAADLGEGKLNAWVKEHAARLEPKLDFSGKFRPAMKGDKIEVCGVKFTSTGSPKTDVYRFIHTAFLQTQEASPWHIYYNSDAIMWGARRMFYGKDLYAYLGDRNEVQQNGMYNNDYWVAKRGLFVDLYPWDDHVPNDDPGQPLGADAEAWNDILETSYVQRKGAFGIVGGFVPWWIKYVDEKHEGVPTEWRFIDLITSYNMGNDADAAFGISNASFFMHMPAIPRDKIPLPPKTFPTLARETVYIAFFMLDYDGSAWLNQAAKSVYEAGGRGRVALNWAINPVLNDRVPHAFRYMIEKRTPLDYFGIEDDGAAYISPLRLVEGHRIGRIKRSGISQYERFAKSYHDRFRIGLTAFYITPAFDPAWGSMAARLTPDGFGVNIPLPIAQIDGTPIVTLREFHVHRVPDLQQYIETVFRDSEEGRPEQQRFHALRCILIPPFAIADAMDAARKKYPDAKVEAVDAFTFFHLRSKWLKRTRSNPPPTSDK